MRIFKAISMATLLLLPAVTGVFAESAKSVNIGGFVDAQGRWKSKNGSDGFAINDGAVYISKEFSGGKALVDLPFKWDATAAGANNDFQFAKGKAQAYINYSFDKMIAAQIGQWDTSFGFEVNDSVDNTFTDTGLIYSINPVTHTGLLLTLTPEVSAGALGVKAFAANANNRGKKNGVAFEYGGQVTYTHDLFHSSLGYLFFNDDPLARKRHYLDLLLGTTVSRLSLDAEVVLLKDSVLNSDGKYEWGQAYFVNAVVKATDKISGGVRGEYVKKAASANTALQITVGPQIALTDALKLKADYSLNRTKTVAGGKDVNIHMLNAGAVFRF